MRGLISARFSAIEGDGSHVGAAVPVRGVNLSLRMMWRQAANFAKWGRFLWWSGRFVMSPDALNSLLSLCIGFALAGALASGYQALVQRPAGFCLLQEGGAAKTFVAVPFLVFSPPFFLIRNTLRGARVESPPLEFLIVVSILAR